MSDPAAAPPPPAPPPPPPPEALWLRILSGPDAGRSVAVAPPAGSLVLGRVQGCDLVVRDEQVSRRHAELRLEADGGVLLRDLGSANGTWVDGERVSERRLSGGERVRIGDVEMVTVLGEPAPVPSPLSPAPSSSEQRPAAAPAAQERHAVASGPEARPAPPTYSMVGRLVDQRTRGARRTTYAAFAVASLAMSAAALSAGRGGGDPVPEVVKRLTPSTVLVAARDGERVSTGSGWVLDAEAGLIVTNAHVVNQGLRYRVVAGGRARKAALVGASPCEDIALLRVGEGERAGLRTAALGSSPAVRHGETVLALGYPAGASASDAMSSTRGVVSVPRTAFRDPAPDVPAYDAALVTDTALNPGNSGGPLIDLEGRVVGVNAAARTAAADGRRLEGQGFAIAIDRVRAVSRELRRGGSGGWSGATFGYPTLEELSERRLPPGLYVTGAVPGTPAARAGLGADGELLTAVDGRPVGTTVSAYCAAVAGVAAGTRVTFTLVAGDGSARKVSLPLG